MSNSIRLGERIADPRALSDELGVADPTDQTLYSGLANYTFGNPRPPSRPSSLSSFDAAIEPTEHISPLTPVVRQSNADRTPRPSVYGPPASPFRNVSSHPSQGTGRPASSHQQSSSHSRRLPSTTGDLTPSGPSSRAVSGSDSERSQDPTPSIDPINPAFISSQQRGRVMPDNASQHTFGPASRTHRVHMASSQDGAAPSSSSVSVTTSRSSSRASMCTTEHFSSDDEFDIDYYDGPSSPVTFARDHLADIDEDAAGPSIIRASFLDGRRGSLPMAIPGAVQATDAFSNRSREGSILTVRRPSRSWDETSTHLSSHSNEDPSLIFPKSEPQSRADWISVGAQLQANDANAYDGFNVSYILSKRSEGSIRSSSSHLSFVHSATYPRRSSPYPSAIGFGPGSSSALPFEDTFWSHIQKNDRNFDAVHYLWSFQREKADASSNSSRRRQQINHRRPDKLVNEVPSRVQEMWRCGQVGRFKVDRLSVKPQSADPAKGAQQRIHIRHIPDPFLLAGNTSTGPHSVIHKHSRAIAFSIFRSHGLFSGRQAGGAGPSVGKTHINMRLGIMLAPKKVQEQYTSTKTTRQLSTYGLLDSESRGSRDKDKVGSRSLPLRDREVREKNRRRTQDDKGKEGKDKGKISSKGKGKDRGDKKHRLNPTESTESSTATSSAGSVNSALKQVVSAPERPVTKIQLSPSISSSLTMYGRDSRSRPASPTSLAPPSINDSVKVPEGTLSSLALVRHLHDHRDSIDSDDRLPPPRTTHAEAFSALDPNDIENLRLKASNRANAETSSALERLLRRFRSGTRTDDHSSSSNQPRAFQPPWLITAGRDQQEENDRVLNDLNASFRDVGLLHANPHKSSKTVSKRKSKQGILDQIPDDCLYMLLPLWPGETDSAAVRAETSSTASFVTTIPENRQYLLVYYVPFGDAKAKDKKPEKKKAKQSHSSDSGVEEAKNIYLSAFRVIARVVTYDELRLTGIRVPSDGLAIDGPEWEAINYPASGPLQDAQLIDTVVCQSHGREHGFDFQQEGLLKLGLCTREEFSNQDPSLTEIEEKDSKAMLTPIGRAAVEMIWLGCLAITSFGHT